MDGDAYGVALGTKVDAYGASAVWATINAKVGTLMIGLTPVLAAGTDGRARARVESGSVGGWAGVWCLPAGGGSAGEAGQFGGGAVGSPGPHDGGVRVQGYGPLSFVD